MLQPHPNTHGAWTDIYSHILVGLTKMVMGLQTAPICEQISTIQQPTNWVILNIGVNIPNLKKHLKKKCVFQNSDN